MMDGGRTRASQRTKERKIERKSSSPPSSSPVHRVLSCAFVYNLSLSLYIVIVLYVIVGNLQRYYVRIFASNPRTIHTLAHTLHVFFFFFCSLLFNYFHWLCAIVRACVSIPKSDSFFLFTFLNYFVKVYRVFWIR